MALQEEIRTEPCALALRVGKKLREARRAKNLTLKDIGIRCGTTPQTIQRLEAATMTMSLHWIELICSALGINPIEVFEQDYDEKSEIHNRRLLRSARISAEALRSHIDHFLQDTEKNAS